MSRSIWKLPYIDVDFYSQSNNSLDNEELILLNRSTLLTKKFLGFKISVYNGIRFFSFVVDSEKLGHYIGEFSPTRKKPILKKKKK